MSSYQDFVYGMLNINAEERATKYAHLTHAVMGLLSEYTELEEACASKRISKIIDEAGDVMFFRELYITEISNVCKDLGITVPDQQQEVNLLNLYRKFLYQENVNSLIRFKSGMDYLLSGFDQMLLHTFPSESIEDIHEKIKKANMQKLQKRYGGNSFDSAVEENRK